MTDFKKAFIDTALFIYLLEENKQYFDKVYRMFEAFFADKKPLVTSSITVEEYCVYPFRHNDEELIKGFKDLIDKLNMTVSNIDNDIALQAARIRAEYEIFKGMDALRLSAAQANGCDIFLTNDKQLKQFKEITVLTVDDFEI